MTVDIFTPEGFYDHRTGVSPENASQLRTEIEVLPGWRIFIY